jgi:hypothetical protein
VLYPFEKHFSCAQAQHFLVFCWLVVALIRAPGKGTLKGLRPSLPAKLSYWPTVRMVRSGQWDAQAVLTDLATATLRSLPPPTDGVLYLIGDRTLKPKRGRKHPLGHFTRHGERDPYLFGFALVLLIASWDHVRVPVALGLIDPRYRGHQNSLFRQMLKAFVPPGWVQQVVVVADAGFEPMRHCGCLPRNALEMCLPCLGRENLRRGNICATWSNICPRVVTIAAPGSNLTAADRITGSFAAAPRSIIWAMSRSYCPRNGVTMGRRA